MPKKQKIQIGNREYEYGKQAFDMYDSNDLYDKKDFKNLRIRLEKEGFLFIRNVINKEKILKARKIMLTQALKENSIYIDEKENVVLDDARVNKKKLHSKTEWCEGYCIDAITGSETNSRENIDDQAWKKIGPSKDLQNVYQGKELNEFWNQLFANFDCESLIKQTFLRMMSSGGTIEHCDYYYFKRDTHIFDGEDGRNAQLSMKQYLCANNMFNNIYYKFYNIFEKHQNNNNDDHDNNKNDSLFCSICEKWYNKSEVDQIKVSRLSKNDFGVQGTWHCEHCALQPLSIYTTWISLSNLSSPNDSILSIVPKSHLLLSWDVPLSNAQVPKDFDFKTTTWLIPKNISFGDILIFNIKTIHASSINRSKPKTFRVSFDTRIVISPPKNNNNYNENNKNLKNTKNKKNIKKYKHNDEESENDENQDITNI